MAGFEWKVKEPESSRRASSFGSASMNAIGKEDQNALLFPDDIAVKDFLAGISGESVEVLLADHNKMTGVCGAPHASIHPVLISKKTNDWPRQQ
jgi:hypothetical protein